MIQAYQAHKAGGIGALVVISQPDAKWLHCGKLDKFLDLLKRADANLKFRFIYLPRFCTNGMISCIMGYKPLCLHYSVCRDAFQLTLWTIYIKRKY